MKKSICLAMILFILPLLLYGCKNNNSDSEKESQSGNEKVDVSDTLDNRYGDKINLNATFTIYEEINDASESNLSVNPVFSDGMVLQRNTVNIISGTTTARNVAVNFGGVNYYGNVTGGNFEVYIPAMSASKENRTLTVYTEKGKKSFVNVVIGEVYVCGGQSNMFFQMSYFAAECEEQQQQIDSADDEYLRLMAVSMIMTTETMHEEKDVLDYTSEWNTAKSENVKNFSAVGYLFGKRMRESLDIPIGLVSTAIAGTSLVYWLPETNYKELVKENYQIPIDAGSNNPDVGFNVMINPIRKLKVRGFIWYQGESDAMNGTTVNLYQAEMEKLISAYRTVFDNPNMTFSIVGLPRWGQSGNGYANVRTADQNVSAKDNMVCLTSNVDNGMWDDIHPYPKTEPALRLANETLYSFFGKDEPRYPIFIKAERINANKVKLTFTEVGDGLVLKNGSNGFEVRATASQQYNTNVSVTLDGKDSITVEALGGELKYLRYAVYFTPNEDSTQDISKAVTLFGSDGMPCDQFVLNIE